MACLLSLSVFVIEVEKEDVTARPGFQASAAPRHRSDCCPSVRTIAHGTPTLLDGAAKVTVVGNLDFIALLKIL